MNNSDLFDRADFKSLAKKRLKKSWTIPVLVSLLCFSIVMVLNLNEIIDSFKASGIDFQAKDGNFSFQLEKLKDSEKFNWFSFSLSIIGIAIAGIIQIATSKFYLYMSQSDEIHFSDFTDALTLWAKGILEMLWVSLFVFLWSLLFFIPGIIKAISYSQAFYILAENPNVSVRTALKMSQKIMKGYKADYFVMQLSFIGWFILALLSAGIGIFWLIPYISLSNTYAYKFLMKNAIERNRITVQELNNEK
ncbi:MAG: DUF975 family protein [Treponemataceae bacterium]